MRYVIEGEWSGYSSHQQHVVHRTVTDRKDIADWAKAARFIAYTDGTKLYLTVRECKPREKVREIHGYDDLIDECRMEKVNSVEALVKIRKEREVARAATQVVI